MPGSALFDRGLIGDREPESVGLKSVGLLTLRGRRKPVTVLTLENDVALYTTEPTGEVVRDRRASDRVKLDNLV